MQTDGGGNDITLPVELSIEEQSENMRDNAGIDNSPQLRRSQRTIRPSQRYGDPAT